MGSVQLAIAQGVLEDVAIIQAANLALALWIVIMLPSVAATLPAACQPSS